MKLPSMNRVLLVVIALLLFSNHAARSSPKTEVCGSENNLIAVYDFSESTNVCRPPAWVINMLMPANALLPVDSGNCPTNFTEVTDLDGQFLIGTTTANGNVGGTGGSTTVTATGTISQPTFTGNAQTFTTVSNVSLLGIGSALNAPTSYTPTGTVSQPSFTGNAVSSLPPFRRVKWCRKS